MDIESLGTREDVLNLIEVFQILKRWRDETIDELDVPHDKHAS